MILCVAFLFGCKQELTVNSAQSLTSGAVKSKITKEKTTQAEVATHFGSPNIVTRQDDCDVWVYDRISTERVENSLGAAIAGGGLIPGSTSATAIGGMVGGRRNQTLSTTRTFTLVIEFDENDVVSDYTLTTTQF